MPHFLMRAHFLRRYALYINRLTIPEHLFARGCRTG